MEQTLVELVLPLPVAVAKTKGISLPSNPVPFGSDARRFLAEMVTSEMIEYIGAEDEAERIDALCDALVYIADSAIRHGIVFLDVALEPEKLHPIPEDKVSIATLIFRGMAGFVELETLAEQMRHLTLMCNRLAYYAEDNLRPYLEEVSRANKSKIADCGRVILNEQGKVMKPDGFVPPNIKGVWNERHK